jgi:5'(3')-deoxyribonucleotidase
MAPARKRICVDMDEVIADAVAEHLVRYNREFREHLTLADLEGKWLWDIVGPTRHTALERYIRSADFFSALAVMPESQRVLRTLNEHYDIFIATAAMEIPTSFAAKYEWLGLHFPWIPASNIVFCGDKSILLADYLIDDNPRQLNLFRGQGILFHAHHNVTVTGFPRVMDWLDVERMFLGEQGPA